MKSLKALVIIPVWLLLAAASPTPTPTPSPPASPSPAPTPVPTPTPLGANIVLDTAAGGPNTRITVTGSSFLPGETMTIYWDSESRVIGNAQADSSGGFAIPVVPWAGDSPGVHRICASVPPRPCASFVLQGPPTPTPPAASSPSAPTPSPSPSPSPSASASPVALTVNGGGRGGLDVITRPPFVFLPLIALLALLAALAYWVLMRGDRTPVLPSASVVHRSARPDIGPVTPRPPPTPPTPPAPPAAEIQPPPAPFDPTEPDPPTGPSETPEPPA
ncbi:MAG TPA: hypothetical protein VF956_05870 [Candidatus Dormibacteraeota bacterium]